MERESILCLITLASWLAGWIVLGRMRTCGHATGSSITAKEISIIIPARNEENNLPQLLHSLASQKIRPREIIVVDDSSEDRTAEIAREYGVQVLTSRALPDGWCGKTWACQQGAQIAEGKYFLFLDADTWFEKNGLARVLSDFPEKNEGALSIAPYHCVQNIHEQFSAFFNLVMLAGTSAFTIFGDRFAMPGLLGQFLLIDRASYEKVGGYETVKGKILENFSLAKRLKNASVPTRCRSGRGLFFFRMYAEGWRQLIEGWTKSFASGASQTPFPILLLIIVWLGAIFFVPIGIFTEGKVCWWAAIYLLCVLQTSWFLGRVGTFHWIVPIFYPFFVLFFFVVFACSVIRSGKNINWKGRKIHAG